MSKVLVDESNLTNIANSIRNQNQTSNTYKPSEMSTAINNLGNAINITKLIDRSVVTFNVPTGTTIIGQAIFSNCSNLTSLTVPTTVTRLNDYAFQNCSNLTNVSDLSAVTYAGPYVFNNTKLSRIEMPSLTSNVNAYTFSNCSNLTYVDLGKCNSILNNAFQNSNNIETLVLRKTGSISTLQNISILSSTKIGAGTGYIYVPDDLVDTYKFATNWTTFAEQIKGLSELEE